MAGTLQTLFLIPPSTRTLSLPRGTPRFPSNHALFCCPSIAFKRNRSICRPISALERSDQRDGNGDKVDPVSGSSSGLGWVKPLLDFATNNFLPLALVGGVAFGLANPSLGCLADRYSLSKFSTFGIFIISGLTLRSGDIGAAAEAWPVGIFGLETHDLALHGPFFLSGFTVTSFIGINFVGVLSRLEGGFFKLSIILVEETHDLALHGPFFLSGFTVTSFIGINFVGVLSRLVSILMITPYFSRAILQMQLQPQEFVTGLAIFSCMPTTLSSGVALTQLAGGNSALALAMTLISNLLGILIVPFSISKLVADGVGVSVPTKQLFRSLVLTLLVPLILGKVLRESFKGLADFVDQNRKLFSKLSALFLSLVPWMQVSRSRSLLLMVKPSIFLVAIGLGALLHVIFLAFNALTIWSLSAVSGGGKSIFLKKENASAFLLVASQKTLPVMVAVVEQLGGALGESGLLVLPCVAAHLNQIIMDSFLVNLWFRKEISSKNAKFN